MWLFMTHAVISFTSWVSGFSWCYEKKTSLLTLKVVGATEYLCPNIGSLHCSSHSSMCAIVHESFGITRNWNWLRMYVDSFINIITKNPVCSIYTSWGMLILLQSVCCLVSIVGYMSCRIYAPLIPFFYDCLIIQKLFEFFTSLLVPV